MRNYIFRFDNFGQFECVKLSSDGTRKLYYGEDAIRLLKVKDRIKFKKARIRNDKLILETPNTKIIINNLEEFYDQELYNCLYHNMKKIDKAVNKYNRSLNSKPGTKKGIVTASIVVAILLVAAGGKLKDNTKLSPADYTTEIEQELEEQRDEETINLIIEDDINSIINTDSEIINSISDYYSPVDDLPYSTIGMLEELESGTEINTVANISLSYDTNYDEIKYNNVVNNYDSIIQERATRWGVDPEIATCMISQESGGYETNLMQIQFDSWCDYPITVYNFEKNRYETIILTDTPEKYKSNSNTQIIERVNLKNPKTNISIGCILLQYSFKQMNNNLPAAIQCYNFGCGNMNKVLAAASKDLGMSVDELLADSENLSFLDYRNIISVGDKEYLEHVFRFLQNPENGIWINSIDENGNIQENRINVTNENVHGL